MVVRYRTTPLLSRYQCAQLKVQAVVGLQFVASLSKRTIHLKGTDQSAVTEVLLQNDAIFLVQQM